MLHAVITTIQNPTPSVVQLARKLACWDTRLVVAGDTKGPDEFDLANASAFSSNQLTFLSIEDQLATTFSLAPLLPTQHYCRKNLGYLQAMQQGASCIYETDDDNAPRECWRPREPWVSGLRFVDRSDASSWVNVYEHFTEDFIWPRGLPLDQIHARSTIASRPPITFASATDDAGKHWAPIQQGLANGAPDVDAIWRLVLDREIDFDDQQSLMLAPGQWCPFNTQTTWWWPEVYALMYIPSYCSFRMCDIWKSFVAQRCLWELGTGMVFHAAEVIQQRNPHNLMRDFHDEISGYEQNSDIVGILEDLSLVSGVDSAASNLHRCYEALVAEGVFPEKELPLVDAWIADVNTVTKTTSCALSQV